MEIEYWDSWLELDEVLIPVCGEHVLKASASRRVCRGLGLVLIPVCGEHVLKGAPLRPLGEHKIGPSGFNPRVRGTCLVSKPGARRLVRPRGRAFQSPCAGNMFGKFAAIILGLEVTSNSGLFQSPCAGNMFGKFWASSAARAAERAGLVQEAAVLWAQADEIREDEDAALWFQSPCAGNMFGKCCERRGVLPTDDNNMFQSPCAGNMFGKVISE